MAANAADIQGWFRAGVKDKRTHMIVVCDTYDHDDYPVYVGKGDDFYVIYDRYSDGQNMQRIMEVYDLSKSWFDQSKGRAHNVPPRPTVSAEPKHE